jgi:acyl-coenzyme A synthetase/AMP-(fatty) acid ligase
MGNRIELGEIEAALLRVDGVTEAVVVFHDSPIVEDKCIGAIICLTGGATKETVVARLQRELPGYMVPRRVEVASELPRTPNGKADRRAALETLFAASGN